MAGCCKQVIKLGVPQNVGKLLEGVCAGPMRSTSELLSLLTE
jgi:hypothetical protein